jgi:hypothetical protein
MEKPRRWAAVLGCGPSGLFATHALVQNGWRVAVFSNKRKSEMFGAQYLHAPIPGLTDGSDPVTVDYRLRGTVEGYREKVYGPKPVVTSVETLGATHQAWDIRRAYGKAWDLYQDRIQSQEVTPEFLGVAAWTPEMEPLGPRLIGPEFDVVLNSIPADRVCYQPDQHRFHSTSIWAMGDAPERGSWAPNVVPFDNTVICDGTRDTGWYRASQVYGYTTVEWPGKSKPPMTGVAQVVKPIGTDCNCYRQGMPYKYIPIGRYGAWSKGILSHHAYTQAEQL